METLAGTIAAITPTILGPVLPPIARQSTAPFYRDQSVSQQPGGSSRRTCSARSNKRPARRSPTAAVGPFRSITFASPCALSRTKPNYACGRFPKNVHAECAARCSLVGWQRGNTGTAQASGIHSAALPRRKKLYPASCQLQEYLRQSTRPDRSQNASPFHHTNCTRCA